MDNKLTGQFNSNSNRTAVAETAQAPVRLAAQSSAPKR
jgi:hypothetical protein